MRRLERISGKAEVQGDRACLGQEATGEGGSDRTMPGSWGLCGGLRFLLMACGKPPRVHTDVEDGSGRH